MILIPWKLHFRMSFISSLKTFVSSWPDLAKFRRYGKIYKSLAKWWANFAKFLGYFSVLQMTKYSKIIGPSGHTAFVVVTNTMCLFRSLSRSRCTHSSFTTRVPKTGLGKALTMPSTMLRWARFSFKFEYICGWNDVDDRRCCWRKVSCEIIFMWRVGVV